MFPSRNTWKSWASATGFTARLGSWKPSSFCRSVWFSSQFSYSCRPLRDRCWARLTVALYLSSSCFTLCPAYVIASCSPPSLRKVCHIWCAKTHWIIPEYPQWRPQFAQDGSVKKYCWLNYMITNQGRLTGIHFGALFSTSVISFWCQFRFMTYIPLV